MIVITNKVSKVSLVKLKQELDPYLRPVAGKLGEAENDHSKLLNEAGRLGAILNGVAGTDITTERELKTLIGKTIGISQGKDSGRVDREVLASFILTHTNCVLRERKQGVDRGRNLLIYCYDEGVYIDGTAVLSRILAQILNYAGGNIWSMGLESAVIALIQRKARIVDYEEFDLNFYAFESSSLDLATLELVDHDPRQLTTIKSHADPRKEATPSFDEFLRTTFDDDQDGKVTQAFVWSWLGYQLDRSTSAEAFLFLVSSGAGGKSSLLNVMRSVVGASNTTGQKLQALSGEFGLQPLLGKTALYSDESSSDVFPVEVVNAITTGSRVTINIKNHAQLETKLRVKLTFAFNQLPPAATTIGFSRRLLLLPFPHVFLKQNANKNLSKSLIAETNGIAFKAIESLRKLRASGYHFLESESMKDAKTEYLEGGLPQSLRYLKDRIKVNVGSRLKKSDVYPDFVAWCAQNGENSATNQVFWVGAKKNWQTALHAMCQTSRVQGYDYLTDVDWRNEGAD